MSTARYINLPKYGALGAIVFWVPDIIVHALTRDKFGGIETLLLTFFLPFLTCFALARARRVKGTPTNFLYAGLLAVLGIWFLGPLMMTLSASFSGGGFTRPDWWQAALLGTVAFPIFTFIMSTYDGTLFAVFVVTAALPLKLLLLKQRPQPAPLPPAK